MKNKYIIILLLTVFLGSCSKELQQDPISSATTATFYKTTNDFLQGINAVYNSLRAYPDRQLNLSETRSDNIYGVSDGGVRDWEGINSFHKTIAINPYVSEAWIVNYQGIFKANTFLDQIAKNGTAAISTPALKTRFEAEARFLRAYYYFDLVRWFGGVPLIDGLKTQAEMVTIPRSTTADVYKLIISDLQFAIQNLPTSYAAADAGRATSFAAKGILALVYMTRSGPILSVDGPGIGTNEWSNALTLLNEIVVSGKFSLVANYADIFSYTKEGNSEVVFDIQYVSGGLGLGATFPWTLVPDSYFTGNGLAAQGGLTMRPISNNMLKAYATGDKRKDFSVQASFVAGGVTENRSFFKKYLDLTKYGKDRFDWPINYIALRYTDILMLKAECLLKTSGAQTDIDAIVNSVRKRAGLTDLTGVTLTQLLAERRVEFAAEGSRWHDLVRFGQVEPVMKAWITEDDVQKQMRPFEIGFVVYPIPQSEMDVKKGLYTQNTGY
jgi:starch-binding outer membrane protein, SusD/RagB family